MSTLHRIVRVLRNDRTPAATALSFAGWACGALLAYACLCVAFVMASAS